MLPYYRSNTLTEGEFDMTTPFNDIVEKHVVKNLTLKQLNGAGKRDAIGFRWVMNTLSERYDLPCFVLEMVWVARESLNENDTVDDDYRIE